MLLYIKDNVNKFSISFIQNPSFSNKE